MPIDKKPKSLKIDAYIGSTVGNFEILNSKYDAKSQETKAFVRCTFCGREKWMRASPIYNVPHKEDTLRRREP